MTGRQSITPHDYQSLGNYLATSAPSCGYPYAILDISRITAVEHMNTATECGTCLRVETIAENYITNGPAIGLPEIAMASHFAATTSSFEPLPLPTGYNGMHRRATRPIVRYTYVLAVDTGGRGLDMAQVAFTALFGQSMSPMPAAWFPVDAKYCKGIWRNSTRDQRKSPMSLEGIVVGEEESRAPGDLVPVERVAVGGPNSTASGLARERWLFIWMLVVLAL